MDRPDLMNKIIEFEHGKVVNGAPFSGRAHSDLVGIAGIDGFGVVGLGLECFGLFPQRASLYVRIQALLAHGAAELTVEERGYTRRSEGREREEICGARDRNWEGSMGQGTRRALEEEWWLPQNLWKRKAT